MFARYPILCVYIFIQSVYSADVVTQAENATESINKTCQLQDFLSGSECTESQIVSITRMSSDTVLEDKSVVTVSGVSDISQSESGRLQIKSNLNVTKSTEVKCPTLDDADNLTQTQLIGRLTSSCRYDRLERPVVLENGTYTNDAVTIYARTYVYAMQILDSSDLQFKIHGLLQLRYVDPRLAFGIYAPRRNQPILGESDLRELIWVPHIFLANEHDSSVLGTNEKDILTTIAANGTVIISTRIQAALSCWMDLRKFPFDEQHCSAVFESWMYNTTQLVLHWEERMPIAFDPKMHLTAYVLQNFWSNETIINADLNDLRHGAFAGNYSSLSFTVHFTRETGYYMMDYFLPSMMIVAISWVSFWLQPDQTPARTTLGTSTMLSFITLASSQDANLPKVSSIKISEIWFFGCTFFIFGSLVEFAFVNTIWRRNRSLALKKVNSKYILKSTLTPSTSHNKLQNCLADVKCSNNNVNNYLTVAYDGQLKKNNTNSCNNSINMDENAANNVDSKEESISMTPHEVSLWIDRKARFAFPLAFIIFNALFWTFAYCL